MRGAGCGSAAASVDRFILDFYCASRKLCVELDGSVHDGQEERDEARSELLRIRGITVIRFRDEEVLNELPAVLQAIRTAAERLRPPRP